MAVAIFSSGVRCGFAISESFFFSFIERVFGKIMRYLKRYVYKKRLLVFLVSEELFESR